jgi:uncharacterized protein YneF (UPF0154 family)
MKPRLVEYLFHSRPPPPPQLSINPPPIKIKQQPMIYESTDYKPLLVNLLCIIFMVLGGAFLYYRKMRKEIEKQEHIQNIKTLYKQLNLK